MKPFSGDYIHFTVTNENYTKACAKLANRYDKKKKIVKAHINRFMILVPVTEKSVSQLRLLTNTSNYLKTWGVNPNGLSTFYSANRTRNQLHFGHSKQSQLACPL